MPRILLIDDDDLFREMLRLTLVKMGHEVLAARNGREAMTLVGPQPPDVVLTDIIMPEKEGLEVIGQFGREHLGVKIIAMSAGGRVNAFDYLKIAKTMGADWVLTKPFANEELALALDKLLGKPPGAAF